MIHREYIPLNDTKNGNKGFLRNAINLMVLSSSFPAREFVSHNLVSYSSLFPSFWFLEVVRRKDIWKAGHIRNLEGIKMSCLKKIKLKKKKVMSAL